MRTRAVVAALGAVLAAATLMAVTFVSAPGQLVSAQDGSREELRTITCTTNGYGYCTIPHDLGVVPVGVQTTSHVVAGLNNYAVHYVKDSGTETTFRVRAVYSKTEARKNLPITFSYELRAPVEPPPPTTTTTTTATTTPPPEPPSGDFPDAASTGPTGPLTVHSGDLTITSAGAVVENKDIRGCVMVKAAGVVIRNSRVAGDCFYLINTYQVPGDWLRVEDVDLVCTDGGTAIGEERLTALRVDISGCENGFDINGQALIQDSYIHGMLQEGTAGDPHSDGAQLVPGATDVTFRHNHFDMTLMATSSIISPSGTNATHDVLVENNLLMGGGYSLYCNQDGAGDNYRVINNRFSTKYSPTGGRAAPWTECGDEIVVGNVWHDGPNAGQSVK
jgi:hypothetical protein